MIGDTAAAVTGAAGSIARPRALSACAEHRELIEAQLRLGRNAVSIYQDSVAAHGFAHGYNSVERFVARLAGIPLCIFGPFQQRQPTSLLIADAPFRAA